MAKKKSQKKKPADDKKAAPSGDVEFLPFEQAFEDGNYAMARSLSLKALGGDQAKRAQAVLDSIRVDRIPLLVFAACLLLISIFALLGLGH